MAAEPNQALAKGYGRFGMGCTRLATALGNFEQGNIQAERYSGRSVADLRATGCHVPHRVESAVSPLYADQNSQYSSATAVMENPLSPKMEDRPYDQYGQCLHTEDRWDQLRQLAGYKQALWDQMGCNQEDSDPREKARRTVPPPGEGSSSRGLSVTSGLPHRPCLMGGGSRALVGVSAHSYHLQATCSFMRWVALATLLLVV